MMKETEGNCVSPDDWRNAVPRTVLGRRLLLAALAQLAGRESSRLLPRRRLTAALALLTVGVRVVVVVVVMMRMMVVTVSIAVGEKALLRAAAARLGGTRHGGGRDGRGHWTVRRPGVCPGD